MSAEEGEYAIPRILSCARRVAQTHRQEYEPSDRMMTSGHEGASTSLVIRVAGRAARQPAVLACWMAWPPYSGCPAAGVPRRCSRAAAMGPYGKTAGRSSATANDFSVATPGDVTGGEPISGVLWGVAGSVDLAPLLTIAYRPMSALVLNGVERVCTLFAP